MKRPLPLPALLLGLGLLLGLALLPTPVRAQHPAVDASPTVVEGQDFRVYDGNGHTKSFAEVIAALAKADAVLVGETHDDVIGHGVEEQIFVRGAQRVGAVGGEAGSERLVVLSLEMFERDVQYIVDEYLDGLITEDQFLKSARPWDRYATDYRPMLEFARAHDLPVVAANAPRRYVNRVSRLGASSLDALSETARSYLPPLPYPLASKEYTAQWNALMAEMTRGMQTRSDSAAADSAVADSSSTGTAPRPAGADSTGTVSARAAAAPAHGMDHALEAQALWDAAMGGAVARALADHPGALVIHYAGSFHVQRGTGIPERVRDYRPGAHVLTVVLEPSADIDAWSDEDHKGLGDFVILTKRPDAG